jgi:pilus assembly protein CpaC
MKCGNNQLAVRTATVRALSLAAVIAAILHSVPSPAVATEPDPLPTGAINSGSVKTRFLALGTGKSVIIDLPREAKDVLVANPKVANAVIRSAQRAYIIGGDVGQTNVVFFDGDGQQIAAYDIAVKRDLNGIRAALRQSLPGVTIEGVGEGVLLTGSVSSPIEAQQAGDVAAKLVGSADKVITPSSFAAATR